jgi:DNA-binding helix-hairpin-helix protein with protein kinase domain
MSGDTLRLVDSDGARFSLAPSDYVAEGGEARVFRRGGNAYKIFYDSDTVTASGKLDELRVLQGVSVAVPIARVFYADTGTPAGIVLPFVTRATTLGELFVPQTQRRCGLTSERLATLVLCIARVLRQIYDARMTVADLSDLNVLVTDQFSDICLIDADSYQTPNYPATAVSPSVEDVLAPAGHFDRGTDWFSFGVLAFTLFVGVHPYGGVHQQVLGMTGCMRCWKMACAKCHRSAPSQILELFSSRDAIAARTENHCYVNGIGLRPLIVGSLYGPEIGTNQYRQG